MRIILPIVAMVAGILLAACDKEKTATVREPTETPPSRTVAHPVPAGSAVVSTPSSTMAPVLSTAVTTPGTTAAPVR